MKAKFHQVPKLLDHTFSLRHDIVPQFGTLWHYHPEIELHYLIKGEGIKFIGDTISNFSEDELILLGSNIPHTWKCNQQREHVEALVMHFHPECFGRAFLLSPEMQSIHNLFELAKGGLQINGETKNRVKHMLFAMMEKNGLEKLIALLEIFNLIVHSKDFRSISANYVSFKSDKIDKERIDKILDFTFRNFRKKITIDEVAALAALSTTSFCRYFKLITQKSYLDFLTEIRLNHACRLILDSRYTMQAIALESGFENTSNFYRHFKNFKQMTPTAYREQHMVVFERVTSEAL